MNFSTECKKMADITPISTLACGKLKIHATPPDLVRNQSLRISLPSISLRDRGGC